MTETCSPSEFFTACEAIERSCTARGSHRRHAPGKRRKNQTPGRHAPARRGPPPGHQHLGRGRALPEYFRGQLSPCPCPSARSFVSAPSPSASSPGPARTARGVPATADTTTAGSVLAAGKDCTVAELDRKGPVLVGRRERALVEDEQRTAAVRFLGPDPDAVIESQWRRSKPLSFAVAGCCCACCSVGSLAARSRSCSIVAMLSSPGPRVSGFSGADARAYCHPSARPCRRVSRCGPR